MERYWLRYTDLTWWKKQFHKIVELFVCHETACSKKSIFMTCDKNNIKCVTTNLSFYYSEVCLTQYQRKLRDLRSPKQHSSTNTPPPGGVRCFVDLRKALWLLRKENWFGCEDVPVPLEHESTKISQLRQKEGVIPRPLQTKNNVRPAAGLGFLIHWISFAPFLMTTLPPELAECFAELCIVQLWILVTCRRYILN